MAIDPRSRILAAALVCIELRGLARTSIEDVATEAGLSRATVYRYFPGGRDQLVSETITWEVGRFFARVASEVAGEPDLAGRLRRGLMFGHRAVTEHRLLQQMLSTEPEAFLAELSETSPLVYDVLRAYLAELLYDEPLQAGVTIEAAADYLARLYLSYLGSQGQWDLTDESETDRLVRTQFLAGIVSAS